MREHSFPPRGALLWVLLISMSAPALAQRGPTQADPGERVPVTATPEVAGVSLFVEIDLLPWDPENIVVAGSEDGLPVVILSSSEFNAADIDVASLSLGGAAGVRGSRGRLMSQLLDIDGDGRTDRIAHFTSHALRIEDDGRVTLRGRLANGTEIVASAPIQIVDAGGIEPVGSDRAVANREAAGLAMRVFPNPARGPFQVALSRAGAGTATVELLDLSGRRIERRSVATSGGAASTAITFTRRLEPGRYLVRVTHGARVTGRMVTILR